MKKFIIFLSAIIIGVIGVLYCIFAENEKIKKDVELFNKEYEFYNGSDVLGVNITTLINMATNNNEKHEIEKDEKGLYIHDEIYSVEIFIEIDNVEYTMEAFNKVGITEFTQLFGNEKFMCQRIEYHTISNRISEMHFKLIS